ncbi:uncharacterized protein LY79DRAFT_521369 [Colletotrichum navitas]|uniref:Glycoside hydrolase family 43 protein n=1 Tax=Colletotrichum navitas TaxID=681940 RepID=A0AAD8PU22_9PEZI|nr:uncharacterized protein LY79DRAFT_521369 [Colletotrichum navitas]KAK1580109.1 hypothetical protein LY79DRAFT_521369 [Colletotrichum navitas]
MFQATVLMPAIILAFINLLVNGQSNDGLFVGNGFIDYRAGRISGQIVRDSQTLASLRPSSVFDFLPSDFLSNLTINGAHHLGDVTFRFRATGASGWTGIDSATNRSAVKALGDLGPGVIAGADLAPKLPKGVPLTVTREWLTEGEGLAVRINLTNNANTTIELGSLGLPVVINNIFTSRSAEDTQAKCSLADPYIGLDAGYVRVSPVSGLGNALVVAPLGKSPFEAWRFLDEPQGDYGYQTQTYEGNYEWMVHSRAWAESEWKSAEPWNTPTSKEIKVGETYSVGLKFSIADSVQTIEDTVVKSELPLAVGIPGYIVPADLTAQLYLTHSSPIKSIDDHGSFTVEQDTDAKGTPYLLTPTAGTWGRAKITIIYEDGKTQAIHYFIIKPAPETVSDLGHFLTTTAHYTDETDSFGRAPSIMGYDREVNAIVAQDTRVWIAGLSDEGGTGAYVAAATKTFVQPVEREVEILDEFVHETVLGTIQPPESFAVRASVFYYEPGAVNYTYNPEFDWTTWASWSKERAYTTVRAYNYVHPVVAYWSLYRVARDYPRVKTRSEWSWYLNQAYSTVQYCLADGAPECDYGLTGLMGETVFAELLEDLKRENMTQEAAAFEESMRIRAEFWETLAVPFGSEMAWDSTGQEGVYYWANYFGLNSTAAKAIDSIAGYMPTVAHWGWNGNARRYWDFNYGAKYEATERQIHHYGSGLNSLPMLHYFERNPADFNAIRVAFAGNTAPLTNIDAEGCPSAAFHSFPEKLEWDPYTGDYGLGFLGLGLGQAMYIVNHESYGEVVFGGNVVASNDTAVVAEPRDAVRRRVFVADWGLKVSLSAGAIQTATYDREGQTLRLAVSRSAVAGALQATSTIVWLTQTTLGEANFVVQGAPVSRGGYMVDLSAVQADVVISRSR